MAPDEASVVADEATVVADEATVVVDDAPEPADEGPTENDEVFPCDARGPLLLTGPLLLPRAPEPLEEPDGSGAQTPALQAWPAGQTFPSPQSGVSASRNGGKHPDRTRATHVKTGGQTLLAFTSTPALVPRIGFWHRPQRHGKGRAYDVVLAVRRPKIHGLRLQRTCGIGAIGGFGGVQKMCGIT